MYQKKQNRDPLSVKRKAIACLIALLSSTWFKECMVVANLPVYAPFFS